MVGDSGGYQMSRWSGKLCGAWDREIIKRVGCGMTLLADVANADYALNHCTGISDRIRGPLSLRTVH